MKHVLYLVLFLIFASLASCTSKSKAALEAKAKEEGAYSREQLDLHNYQVLKAKHVNTNITTNIIAHKEDKFDKGDTVITVYNEGELQVRYDVQELQESHKLLRKVIIQ